MLPFSLCDKIACGVAVYAIEVTNCVTVENVKITKISNPQICTNKTMLEPF